MPEAIRAYHGNPAIKAFHVSLARHHYEADMLLAGTYGEQNGGTFRGCSIGCMAHDIKPGATDDLHAIVAEHAGWPEWLARLNDSIFEGLPRGERERFHVELREAVPVGANLEPVRHLLAMRRIDRLIATQEQAFAAQMGDVRAAIGQVLAALATVRRCHEAEAGAQVCVVSDWESAAESAWSAAARSAAESAWSAAARSAARSAAWSARSAAWSARSAAESAWSAAAWSAAESAWSARSAAESAWSAAWKQEAADLLELLAAATP